MCLCIKGFAISSLFRTRVGGFVPSFIYIDSNVSRVDPSVPEVVSVPSIPSVTVVPVEMSVVIRKPVVMITVVVVPVVGTPGVPVAGIITPVPGGTPDYVVGHVNEPYYRPC